MSGPQLLSASLRTPARWLRHLPDRWLHRRRRAQAVRTLRALGAVRGILILCHGNICRSPYAGAVLKRRLAQHGLEAVQVDSAGFMGPDRPPPEIALEVARHRGYDLQAHRSRLVTAEALAAAEFVLVMDQTQRRRLKQRLGAKPALVLLLGDFDPEPITTRAIRDPVDGPLELFEEVYNRLERCLGTMLGALTVAACWSPLPGVATRHP
jgi:protein-tyrosine phosphatase